MSAPGPPPALRQPYRATPLPGAFPSGKRAHACTRAVAEHVIAATDPADRGLPAGTPGVPVPLPVREPQEVPATDQAIRAAGCVSAARHQ